jgi:hypothetical protein
LIEVRTFRQTVYIYYSNIEGKQQQQVYLEALGGQGSQG